MDSPSCKFYSRARVKGQSTEPPLIDQTRDLLRALYELWTIENVMGARKHMAAGAAVLHGALFGLRVARARLIESNWGFQIDECLERPARLLEARCCLGRRRRWRQFDTFGRPRLTACCDGNIYTLQGKHPYRCTHEDSARAMGMDPGHMPFDRLAQSIPADYGQYVCAKLCMHACNRWFGVPVIEFDDMVTKSSWARRTMAMWLRGAGGSAETVGMTLALRSAGEVSGSADERERDDTVSGEVPASARVSGLPREVACRELYYSHAGGYTQQWVSPGLEPRMAAMGGVATLASPPTLEQLRGQNTFVEVSAQRLATSAAVLRAAASLNDGTRVTVVTDHASAAALHVHGYVPLICPAEYGAGCPLQAELLCAVCVGRRKWASRPHKLVYEAVRPYMDPRDQGDYEYDAARKQRAAWREMPWLPELWEKCGVPSEVQQMMQQGARVEMAEDIGAYEIPQYEWPSGKALSECILETDRALAVGAMEYVPDDEIRHVLENHVVHPWTVALRPKPRACQDYSGGTNRAAISAPFVLPTVWDVRRVIGPDTHFVAYDLRDGFWSLPVHPESRNRLVMRHPGNCGRLIRAARFPFGYKDSPRLFCALTEALAHVLRDRLAGKGIHIYCYVDDFLLVGETREAALLAAAEFEKLIAEVGMEWAPHKQRGPCRCIRFLGLLLCNTPEYRCIGLTEERQLKLRAMLDMWLAREPPEGAELAAEPREVAELLGNLVFASQVVPGGRTYMQAMLSSFAGMEVNWKLGQVKLTRSERWGQLQLRPSFWRDLSWWSQNLESRNCVRLDEPERGEAAITGTDASDWGTGQLVWLDGRRGEAQLEFTHAERRRSINWRELLGVLRVVSRFGRELAGRAILLETDNMAAKGAAAKMASSSEDMQELVRRLLEVCEAFDISVRLVHSPGELLHRPDQTSRGDPLQEPRVRICAEELAGLETRFGPFSEVLGAERRLMERPPEHDGPPRIWMHPAHTTVATALRMLGERLAEAGGERASGVVVVPHDEAAGWWSMVGHFNVVGRFPAGSRHLEMNQLGTWQRVTAQRPSLVLTFGVCAAGVVPRPLSRMPGGATKGYMPYEGAAGGSYLPMARGSYFYTPAERAGDRGVLYVTWSQFHPGEAVVVDPDDGSLCVCGAELLRSKDGVAPDGTAKYELDARVYPEGSFAPGGIPWQVSVGLAFDVSHLVHTSGSSRQLPTAKRAAEKLEFRFSFREAERQIAAVMRGTRAKAPVPDSAGVAARPPPRRSARGAQPAPEGLQFGAERAMRAERRHDGGADRDQASEAPPLTPERGASPRVDGGPLLESAPQARAGAAAPAFDMGRLQQVLLASVTPGGAEGLARARESAAAAAALKKPPPAVLSPRAAASSSPRRLELAACVPCRYPNMVCAGCELTIPWGTRMVPAGRGFAHWPGECQAKAEAALTARIAEGKEQRQKPATALSSVRRATQMAHQLSAERLQMVMDCVDSKCRGKDEPRVMCTRGCGRGVHVISCCMLTKGFQALGAFECGPCRAADMAGISCSPEGQLLAQATRSSLVEMASGADSTARGYSEFVRLEREWVADLCKESDIEPSKVSLPHTNAESFYAFVIWLANEGHRARSMGTILRAAGGYMTRLEYEDFTKSTRIKVLLKGLELKAGVITTPCTHVTPMLVSLQLTTTLPQRCAKAAKSGTASALKIADFREKRCRVMIGCELVGGFRIGEVTGHRHGLDANDVCIQERLTGAGSELGETIECRLDSSKTGMGRYVTFAGKTRRSGIDTALALREYWRVSGTPVNENVMEAGFQVTRPDYWVVRVDLCSMSDEAFNKFVAALNDAAIKGGPVGACSRDSLFYAKSKREATTLGESARFVNIAGGRRDSQEVRGAHDWCGRMGLGAYSSVVAGPLIRNARGHVITHMPFEPETDDYIVDSLKMAYESMVASGAVDPDLDLGGLEQPHFGTHSYRRQADRVAQATRDKSGASTQDIDFFFGWNLAKMAEDMQLWYSGLDRFQRLQKLARVTLWL